MRTKWPFGRPLGGVNRVHNQGKAAPKPDEILVQGGSLVNHGLLLPEDAGANNYLVATGNTDFQSALVKPISRKSAVAVYSLENFAGNG